MLLHEWLLQHYERRANCLAILTPQKGWTFKCLYKKSQEFKAVIQQLVFSTSYLKRIIILLENSPEAIAIAIACSMLGITFVPVDKFLPKNRLNFIINEVNPIAIVTETIVDSTLPQLLMQDENLYITNALSVAHDTLPLKKIIDVDLAYIVYTSGSTGLPKGIMMSHHAVVTFFKGLTTFYQLSKHDRYASTSPFHFDFALLDIGLCLGSGATLVIPERKYLRKPKVLAKQFSQLKINHISGVPTIWSLLLNLAADEVKQLDLLKRIVFAGEKFPVTIINEIYTLLPSVRFINVYGQSESVACSFYELPYPLPMDICHLPVGFGHEACDMLLFKDGHQVTTPNIVGELYLRGSILFDGYLHRKDLTKKSLIQNPLIDPEEQQDIVFKTGDLVYFDTHKIFYFVDRKDRQIQIGGHRVEPAEIEETIKKHFSVKDCYIFSEEVQDPILVACVLVDKVIESQSTIIRDHCMSFLPHYMIPKKFFLMDYFPTKPSGKIDREKLLNLIREEEI